MIPAMTTPPMHYVLFYGRHAITTRAQERYLRACILARAESPTKAIFAVTSANHARAL